MTLAFDDLLVFLAALVGLFSPFANIGPVASLIGHFPRSDQRKIAAGVFINVIVVLLVFLWIGQVIFEILGVNSDSLTLTGGIALMFAGLPMMLDLGNDKNAKDEDATPPAGSWRSMVVIPMTFPMSIGGTDAAYMVTASSLANNYIDMAALSVVVLIFCLIIWATNYFSPVIAARLSPLGRQILTRIGGIILIAIAVQLLASGLKGLFPVLAG